jgi:hypothetical protein
LLNGLNKQLKEIMALTKKEFSDYIKQFNFRELFNDMGWNNDKTKQPIVVDNETCILQAVGDASREFLHLFMPEPTILSFQFISFE